MKLTKSKLKQIIKEETDKVMGLSEGAKVIEYSGNAPDIIDPAVELGWEFAEDDYVDASGVIDWDRALEAATEFLQNSGYRIEYS